MIFLSPKFYVKSFFLFFSVTFVLMRDIKTHAADIIDWFIEKGVYLPSIRNTPVSSNGTLSDNTSYRDDLIRVRLCEISLFLGKNPLFHEKNDKIIFHNRSKFLNGILVKKMIFLEI